MTKTDVMSDAQINNIVRMTSEYLVDLCEWNADAVIMAAFGLLAHLADSFNMQNEQVHQALSEVLRQRPAAPELWGGADE